MKKAKKKHPLFPDHIAAQAGIVSEESGELMQACLQFKYEKADTAAGEQQQIENIKVEAVQVIVAAIRFLENFKPKTHASNTSNPGATTCDV